MAQQTHLSFSSSTLQDDQKFGTANLGSPYKPVAYLQINDLCEWLRVDFATEKHGKTRKYSVISVSFRGF